MDVSLMEKFYSKLFGTPKEIVSAGILVVSIVLASVLNGYASFFLLRYVSFAFSTFLALLLIRKPMKLAFNRKRLLFLVMAILTFIEIYDLIFVHVFGKDLIILSPACLTSLLTVVFYFTSEASTLGCVLSSLLLSATLYPFSYLFSFKVVHRTIAYTATSLLGCILGALYLKYLDKDYGFFNVKRFLKAFLLFWLTCDPEYFERELRRVGKTFKGWVKCIRIGRARLVTTSFHPGPMRNIGGGRLVETIMEKENTMYLHSPVGHELNPVDFESVKRIASSLNCDDLRLKPLKPFDVEGERYVLRVFPFDCVRMMILIGKDASDDLPFELNELVGKNVLVEAHSAHSPDFDSGEVLEEVKELVRKGLETKSEPTDLGFYFKRARKESKNICGWLAILLLDYGDVKHALLMLDGNNVDLNFRKELEEYLESRGFVPTIVSTDNHSKTAVSPKIGYKPVGADEEDRKVVYEFLNSALSNVEFEKCDARYGFGEVEAKVMGREFFELVETAFREMGEKAIRLFFSFLALQFLVSALLGMALMPK